MKNIRGILLAFFVLYFSSLSFAQKHGEHNDEKHDHQKESNEKHKAHQDNLDKKHEEHGEHEGHDETSREHGEHGDHDEDSGEHDDHGSVFGKGKAIVEVAKEGKRFKLSQESINFLDIQTSKLERLQHKTYQVQKSSIAEFQIIKAIYIEQNGWFEMVEISPIDFNGPKTIIRTHDELLTEARVVTKGLAYLRAAQLQASGQGGEGHAH